MRILEGRSYVVKDHHGIPDIVKGDIVTVVQDDEDDIPLCKIERTGEKVYLSKGRLTPVTEQLEND